MSRWAPSLPIAVLLLMAALPALGQANVMQRIQYGQVVSAEPVIVKSQPSGSGARVGSTVGAVAGYALADRGDRWLGGLLGGVVGGALGHAAEQAASAKRGWQLIIRLDSGEDIGIQVPGRRRQYRPGDRVRLMTGAGKTKVSKA